MKIAVFPGSFDPITIGHQNIVERALPLFDKIIVAIGQNSLKNYYFTLEQRIEFIKQTFSNNPTVAVTTYSGLTIDFCKQVNSKFILRGIRNVTDYSYENAIAQMNNAMNNGIETIFLPTIPELSAINSTIIRDILIHGGEVSKFVPAVIKNKLKK
ncbi:MAG: pantetheine-phosphate adenylyltransferase [Flavobacteriales bacterium CG_4_10_14_0_2_um_filter_32_8]|nr:MAG: pantetheine-phosphate adenylyltransferase [Flavobacteriales bacterium CG_4_10_14_0_2_um_filter_32_8]PJB14766.1 MAG: pantetheine-phosphate adenylyltransferase [Flavobacteriales bacterium CG_4_9_14_3_um_filter_32_8]